MSRVFVSLFCLSLCLAPVLSATTLAPRSFEERAEQAGAIARGTVETVRSFRGKDGFIYSEATIRVDRVLKGRFGQRFPLVYRGGRVANVGETGSDLTSLRPGDQRLFLLTQDREERLIPVDGLAGVVPLSSASRFSNDPEQAVTQFRQRNPERWNAVSALDLSTTGGSMAFSAQWNPFPSPGEEPWSPTGLLLPPRRNILPDRGEPIRYVVDADRLPAGITLPQALAAVANALQAWAEVSSLAFTFDGLESFGMSAYDLPDTDNRLYIQLHDRYGAIPGDALGIGGNLFQWFTSYEDGGTGGEIGETPFHQIVQGYVVIAHDSYWNSDPSTLEAVICHEIGHALGLDHSSEDPYEADFSRSQALMYFGTKADGSGAALRSWDTNAIRQVHPLIPPPGGFDRYMRVVHSPVPLASPRVNEIELISYTTSGRNLSFEMNALEDMALGHFSLTDTTLTFSPKLNNWGDSPRLTPEDGRTYGWTLIRAFDGTNYSAPFVVYLLQSLRDSQPSAAPDGLPDSWMITHFGSATPVAGFSGPQDDPDGDGLSNLNEFRAGTNPQVAHSHLAVTLSPGKLQWAAHPYDLYELYSSTDLIQWNRQGPPRQPVTTEGEAPLDVHHSTRFYRVERVP